MIDQVMIYAFGALIYEDFEPFSPDADSVHQRQGLPLGEYIELDGLQLIS